MREKTDRHERSLSLEMGIVECMVRCRAEEVRICGI